MARNALGRGLGALIRELEGKKPEPARSEEHTSELQSHHDLVCRLLLEKKKKNKDIVIIKQQTKKIHHPKILSLCNIYIYYIYTLSHPYCTLICLQTYIHTSYCTNPLLQ